LTNIFGSSAWTTGVLSDHGYFTTTYTPYLPFVGQNLSAPSDVNFGSFDLLPTFLTGSHTDQYSTSADKHVDFEFDVTQGGHTDEYEVLATITSPPHSLNFNGTTLAGSSGATHVNLTELEEIAVDGSPIVPVTTTNTHVTDPGTGNTSLHLADIYVDTISYGLPNPFNSGTSIGGYITAVPEAGTAAGMVGLICSSGMLGLVTRRRARA
jgi:hypothetical protein